MKVKGLDFTLSDLPHTGSIFIKVAATVCTPVDTPPMLNLHIGPEGVVVIGTSTGLAASKYKPQWVTVCVVESEITNGAANKLFDAANSIAISSFFIQSSLIS
jgi:hypothetical protein